MGEMSRMKTVKLGLSGIILFALIFTVIFYTTRSENIEMSGEENSVSSDTSVVHMDLRGNEMGQIISHTMCYIVIGVTSALLLNTILSLAKIKIATVIAKRKLKKDLMKSNMETIMEMKTMMEMKTKAEEHG